MIRIDEGMNKTNTKYPGRVQAPSKLTGTQQHKQEWMQRHKQVGEQGKPQLQEGETLQGESVLGKGTGQCNLKGKGVGGSAMTPSALSGKCKHHFHLRQHRSPPPLV